MKISGRRQRQDLVASPEREAGGSNAEVIRQDECAQHNLSVASAVLALITSNAKMAAAKTSMVAKIELSLC
jgi:hypothetical protein